MPRCRLASVLRLLLLTVAGFSPSALAQQVPHYDVLVYGSEPEAVAAAVAAAESGASTLLLTRDARIGGLFVLGELNMLDLRTQPFNYQRGVFDRWWRRVGHTEAFDVLRAERAFEALLQEAGVEVRRSVGPVAPLLRSGRIAGVLLADGSVEVRAQQVIDASADAELAAAAGAPFDFGFERFGVKQRMADTLVLNVKGVDWRALTAAVRARGRGYAVVKESVAWGHFDGVPAAYQPKRPNVRLRGLNLGLQDDGAVLVNALLLHGLDPLDPVSLEAGRQLGLAEGQDMIAYLRQHLPGFQNASLDGAATTLYVRESRHLLAHCILSADDVLDSVVTPFDVAAGGYPLDAQAYTPHDSGFVWGTPDIYGGRLCMMVTPTVPDLWVVGRSAGYDPIAFSSARVVPFGMAMGEAAGVAAALAAVRGLSSVTVASLPEALVEVRAQLALRGAYIPEIRPRLPVGPVDHPNYAAFRTLLSRGLAVGGYDNRPLLDQPVSSLAFAYLLSNVATRFFLDSGLGDELVTLAGALTSVDAPLSAEVAVALQELAACRLLACPEAGSWNDLVAVGLAAGPEPQGGLSRGQAYELAALLARTALE